LSGTTHNVFGIQVGVSINFLVKTKPSTQKGKIYYAQVDKFWSKEEKYGFLDKHLNQANIAWQEVEPDKKYNWLTEGLRTEFESFIPIGNKAAKAGVIGAENTIFATYSTGVYTGRDAWVYGYDKQQISERIKRFMAFYELQLAKWEKRFDQDIPIDDFLVYDDEKIKWSRNLKQRFQRGLFNQVSEALIRRAIYRPYHKRWLYFDNILVDEQGLHAQLFPARVPDVNQVIWLKVGSAWPMFALMVNVIPDYMPQGGSQCFPFYVYDEDGSHCRENITAWALDQFRSHYDDDTIAKWDIFHYVYALLHHPHYRKKYAANLRRELPRIPFAPTFWPFAETGAKLAELHVNYEAQPEYPLHFIENPDEPLDWRVEKMKLSKDKTQIVYNNFLTLGGTPPEVFAYRLGNRSALHWIIDQYRVKTDKRSGIVNDPNNLDDPQYIVRLIGQVITVSLETVTLVKGLPELD
jgi:predicted helicase